MVSKNKKTKKNNKNKTLPSQLKSRTRKLKRNVHSKSKKLKKNHNHKSKTKKLKKLVGGFNLDENFSFQAKIKKDGGDITHNYIYLGETIKQASSGFGRNKIRHFYIADNPNAGQLGIKPESNMFKLGYYEEGTPRLTLAGDSKGKDITHIEVLDKSDENNFNGVFYKGNNEVFKIKNGKQIAANFYDYFFTQEPEPPNEYTFIGNTKLLITLGLHSFRIKLNNKDLVNFFLEKNYKVTLVELLGKIKDINKDSTETAKKEIIDKLKKFKINKVTVKDKKKQDITLKNNNIKNLEENVITFIFKNIKYINENPQKSIKTKKESPNPYANMDINNESQKEYFLELNIILSDDLRPMGAYVKSAEKSSRRSSSSLRGSRSKLGGGVLFRKKNKKQKSKSKKATESTKSPRTKKVSKSITNHNLNNTISIPVSIPVSYINTQEISKLQLFKLGFSNKRLFRKNNNEMLLFIYNRHNKNKLYLHNKGFVVYFYELRSKDIIKSGRFADPASNNSNKINKDEENNKRRRLEFKKQINFTHFDYKENKKSKTNELTFYFKNKKKDKIYNCKEVFENLYRYLTTDKTSLLHNMYLIFNIDMNNETFYRGTIRIRIDDLFNLLLKTRNFKLKLMDLLEHTMFIEEVLSKKDKLNEINSNKSNKKYNYFKEVPKFFKIDKLTDIQLNQESLDKKNTDILLNNVMLFIFKNIKHIKNASKNTYKLTIIEEEYIGKRLDKKYIGKRKDENDKKELEAAATKIQALWRSKKNRKQEKINNIENFSVNTPIKIKDVNKPIIKEQTDIIKKNNDKLFEGIDIDPNTKAEWLKIKNDAKKRFKDHSNPQGYQGNYHHNEFKKNKEYLTESQWNEYNKENPLAANRRKVKAELHKLMSGGLSHYSKSKTKKSLISNKSSRHNKSITKSVVNYLEFTLNFNDLRNHQDITNQ